MKFTKNTLHQVGIVGAFINKVYNGTHSIADLKKLGNLGIGTFDEVHGELIAYNNKYYAILEDGVAKPADEFVKTPFAFVLDFEKTGSILLEEVSSFENFAEQFDAHIPSKNYIYAYHFTTQARDIFYRSECAQSKPYHPLKESFADCERRFTLESAMMHGVGFRFPDYCFTFNVPGHHIHFHEDSQPTGGHVFDFKADKIDIEVCVIENYQVHFPNTAAFADCNIDIDDLEKSIHLIEKPPKL
jgi:acetolactate decarboxylase